MKVTKEIDFDFDVDYFIKQYAIVSDTSHETIEHYLEDYLCGCEDDIYYHVSVEDLLREYISEIDKKRSTHQVDILEAFNNMVEEMCLDKRGVPAWNAAIPVIKQILARTYGK